MFDNYEGIKTFKCGHCKIQVDLTFNQIKKRPVDYYIVTDNECVYYFICNGCQSQNTIDKSMLIKRTRVVKAELVEDQDKK